MTQESLSNAVALSSSPPEADFLYDRGFLPSKATFYPTIMLAAVVEVKYSWIRRKHKENK